MSFRQVAKGRMRVMCVAMGLGIVLTGATVARAEDPAPVKPNSGKLTVTSAFDLSNAYMFRGVKQDTTRLIMWPAVDLGFAAFSGKGGLKSVGVNFGTWNSLNTGDSGLKSATSGLGCACGKLWYESDFYATLGLGFGGGAGLSTTYTAYTSPNSGFTTVKEIMFKVSDDDSAYLKKGALHPYGIVAFEFNTKPGVGQADGGTKRGTYIELGVAPGWSGAAASLAFPVKVGLSGSNYYEFNSGTLASPNFTSDTFGYFSAAGTVTVPLKGVAASMGAWNVHAGVEFQQYGGTLKSLNGENHQVIGSGGIGFTY